ncbi:hypothetical protein J7E47_18530, partial [Pseudomonas fluorescens]|nr:hypothetical protein [Pseudomonas fluorescens]
KSPRHKNTAVLLSHFSYPNHFVRQYVVLKNNHYKIVDASDLALHDADVSPIGSTGKCLSKLV